MREVEENVDVQRNLGKKEGCCGYLLVKSRCPDVNRRVDVQQKINKGYSVAE